MNAKIIAPIIVIIVIAGAAFFFLNPQAGPPAKLIINAGTVEVDSGSGWAAASNNMELKQDWSVRTLEGASATILFFDSTAMRLDENTEITLTTLNPSEEDTQVVLEQNGGRTWNRILLLSGIENYEVNTPDAVASVRGTGFFVKDSADSDDIWASDGHVVVGRKENGSWIEATDVGAEESARIGQRIARNVVQADNWVRMNLDEDEKHFQAVKLRLLAKYRTLIELAKTQGLAEENVENYLEGYVRGRTTIRDMIDSGQITEEQAKLLPLELRRERRALRTAAQEAEQRGLILDQASGNFVRSR